MPLTGEAKREYQRNWIAKRRGEYLAGRACVLCGSSDSLEFDHLNESHKVSHRIWSWSRSRLEAELAKCVVVCQGCHQERHALERRSHGRGGYERGCRCEVCVGRKRESNERYRRRRESNADLRLCRPAHDHSATAPRGNSPRDPSSIGPQRDERNRTGGMDRS